MVIRVAVQETETSERLVEEFASLFDGRQVTLRSNGEIELELRGEANGPLYQALKAIERTLEEAAIATAKLGPELEQQIVVSDDPGGSYQRGRLIMSASFRGRGPMHPDSAANAVIVDEQPLRLDGLEALIRRLGITAVSRATSREEASSLVDERRPDLLVTSYALAIDRNEGEDGVTERPLALLERARAANTDVKCIVLSDRDEPSERAHAFRSGATVYCVKHAAVDDFAVAVRQAFAPSIYFAPTDRDPAPAAPPADSALNTANGRRTPLTKREGEILRLAADGRSNSQIAKMLWVTEPTVKFHLSNIYRKLGVVNRTEASRWAYKYGLLAGDALPRAS